ncbi:MAG: hypothetical protein ACR2Q4_00245, partial [Geminicoccaceae bacterium]
METEHTAPKSGPSRKILLVTWYFPPINAIAAIRLGKMARYLRHTGHRVRVITPRRTDGDQSLPVEIDDEAIKRTSYLDLDRRFNPTNLPGFTRKPPGSLPGSFPGQLRQKARRLLGSLYRNVVLYPDQRIDWLFTLLPALRREIRSDRPDL